MLATWPRSTSSLMAARMPITPPAITNCTPRVQELVGWYLGTPSTALRSCTIRFLVWVATARMPSSSLSHQALTSPGSHSARSSGQKKNSPSSIESSSSS